MFPKWAPIVDYPRCTPEGSTESVRHTIQTFSVQNTLGRKMAHRGKLLFDQKKPRRETDDDYR
jgi:hypothetical protein